jgi:hypothetical protein
MEARLAEAVARTRDEISTDAYVFVEGDERHFLGETVTLAVAAWVVSTFLHGFTEAAKDDIDGWGRRAYGWLRKGVQSVFANPGDVRIEKEAAEAASVARSATDADVEAYAQASDTALRAALVEYGLDWVAAERVATLAREAGLQAIGV